MRHKAALTAVGANRFEKPPPLLLNRQCATRADCQCRVHRLARHVFAPTVHAHRATSSSC